MRQALPREFFIPEGATRIPAPEGIEVYSYETGGRPAAVGFHGRRQRPDFHYRFMNETSRTNYITQYIQNQMRYQVSVRNRRQARVQPHTLQVGDILYTAWGYDQTNIDFYQVTRIVGTTMVEIREVAHRITSSEQAHDYVVPVQDRFINDLILRRRVNGRHNTVSINSYATAHPYDGLPRAQTASGYGH